ncbi:hypothetical protein MTP48_17025 [Erwinia amylovora]|nr:hypothetical protein [Erwinia amylovora]MCZ2719975.1 hypothetical protein [Erwinia amylovora]
MNKDILALASMIKQAIESHTSFKLPPLSGSEFKAVMQAVHEQNEDVKAV